MNLSSTGSAAEPHQFAGKGKHRLREAGQWIWRRPWVALPFIAIPCAWPFFQLGLPQSADGALHLLRLALLDYHIQQGVFYPRWVPELVMGLGYPVFSFYGPASYYLAEFFHLLGGSYPQAFMLALSALILVAGAGMYRLAQDVFGSPSQRWAALLAAAAYMAAPYLLTNVYIRGAIAEVGAQALLPWVLWSLRRLLTEEQPEDYVLAVALSLGGLAITHNITLLFVPPLVIGYVVILWWHAGRPARRLAWAAAAIAAAAGLSAFFWLPVIFEREYLSEAAYRISTIYLPENLWSWRNFLDLHFRFDYTFSIPFQLGLVQLGLALIGFVVARRWDIEWMFFLAVAILSGLAMGRWSEAIWLGNSLLLVAQFPWRLLTMMSLPLALFTGAIVMWPRRGLFQAGLSIALSVLVVFANSPQVGWMPQLADARESITVPSVAQFERETGALGTSSASEFRPRWSLATEYASEAEPLAASMDIRPQRVSSYNLEAAVSTSGGPLRFATLYFPGWRVSLNGEPIPSYPSTSLGLLTVDVPPGNHELRVTWGGTSVQHLATAISIMTLLLLAIFGWSRGQRKWLALIPGSMVLVALIAIAWPADSTELSVPAQTMRAGSVTLLGFYTEPGDGSSLYIRPYWYVNNTPSPGMSIRWQLRDKTGSLISDSTSRPYFNNQDAKNWPPGTVVDDGYRLPLPSGLVPGDYALSAEVLMEGEVVASGAVGVLSIDPQASSPPQPNNGLEVNFGDVVTLQGYDLDHKKRDSREGASMVHVVHPGDTLKYTLYWQARRPLSINYHSFVHLVDQAGRAALTQDHLAGSFFRAPMLWDTLTLQRDRYRIRIPATTPNGLYTPVVGLYDFDTMQRLQASNPAGEPIGDVQPLPPIKVLGKNPQTTPQNSVDATLGGFATLLGYDLSQPETGLHPGSTFTLTLQYESLEPALQDLTQFVHLYDPGLGMAAQHDSRPLEGANPTWAWVPGEIITDTLSVTVPVEATPGTYKLYVGLYDPSDGSRVPVRDKRGELLADGRILLADLSLQPPMDF